MLPTPLIQDPPAVLAVLLGVLALLFIANEKHVGKKVFKIIPLLVFAYFIPTLLSNFGIIPLKSPLYTFVKKWLLPASLLLLTLSVDIPAILKLAKNAVVMFLLATLGIVVGAPIAYWLFGGMVPPELGDQAWKGLAALAGSWIGGGANFIAIGESVGAHESTISMMVVVDVAVASVWMACLLYFAGREKEMDAAIGADRATIDELREKVEHFEKKVSRPTTLPDLLAITALAFVVVTLSKTIAGYLPDVGAIIRGFTWVVILVTTAGVSLSFTRVRNLEGAGASKVGSLFLYLLVATIGAKAEFARVMDAPALVLVGGVWMAIHAIVLLLARRKIKSPVFFLAVGSQANVGGAASAPIVASAFHPALAPVGVLLAVGGYVLGTYAGLLTAFLLQLVHGIIR
jgi:uncharacterized membrane protein